MNNLVVSDLGGHRRSVSTLQISHISKYFTYHVIITVVTSRTSFLAQMHKKNVH